MLLSRDSEGISGDRGENKTKDHYKTYSEVYTKEGEDKKYTYLVQNVVFQEHSELFEMLMKEKTGYRFQVLPMDDDDALKTGRVYVNRGQCVPVVYWVGSLINYIQKLRKDGLSDKEITSQYAYLISKTKGGSCRLPAYEEELRKAMHAIGLKDFIIEVHEIGVFKNVNGYLKMGYSYHEAYILTYMVVDILTDIERRIRPYEIDKGATDETMAEVRKILADNYSGMKQFYKGVLKAKELIERIPVNFAQLKPKVSVVGEIYVSLSAGHSAGNLVRWLESEGAEVYTQPSLTFVLHKMWRKGWMNKKVYKATKHKTFEVRKAYYKSLLIYMFFYYSIKYRRNKIVNNIGNYSYPLLSTGQMIEVTQNLYNKAFTSGESFMEIARHLLDVRENNADMTISVKPFTCLPSVCSDAVQYKVETMEDKSIFIALEMSGDNLISNRSRMLMKLFEARQKIRKELETLGRYYNKSVQEMENDLKQLKLRVPALNYPKTPYASTYLNLVNNMYNSI